MDFINNIKTVFQTSDKIKWIDINKIIIDTEMEGIFVQKETEIQNIANNMAEKGFDPAHPIILAHSKVHPELNDIIADGHTRCKAAKRAELTKVAIIYKEFANREELLKFVYEQSLLRRNLTEREIFNAWQAMNRLCNEKGKKAKSDSEIAEELQISRRQVCKMKELEKKATPEVLESIKSGELSINKAYVQIKETESKSEDYSDSVSKENDNHTEVEPEQKTKYSKDFIDGYTTGWMYVYESLRCGKLPKDLQSELTELSEGRKTVELLQKSLIVLKEAHEQKQAQ